MSRRLRRAMLMAGMGLLASGPAVVAPAGADDLRSALVSAYQTNPTLQAARANQRANDENVPIQRAAGLPSASLGATHTEIVDPGNAISAFTSPDRQFQGNLTLNVPIYSGGAVRNSVSAAKVRVEAGQADLRGTESQVFSQAVAAYMDVIQNEAIVGLNRNNVEVLEVNLRATSDRFEIGDLTRTDVAQSRSRLELARGQARTAEANLVAARERYIQVIGAPPGTLAPPPPLPGLPASPDDATRIALENNPDLIAARERSKAAEYDIEVAGAGRLPKLEVFTGGTYTDYYGTAPFSQIPGLPATQSSRGATAGVRASIPIFQGGRPAAQERQAQARAGATLEQEIEAERGVIAQVRSAYSSWRAANEIIASSQSAVDAASLSLEGVRAENSVGNRTILDILNAEQELLNAQVELVRARRNAYVAGFSLLAAMGRAEAQDLGLEGGPLYDPNTNYKRVRGKVFDWEFDPDPVARSTRTVTVPAQDASVAAQPPVTTPPQPR
ncbi:MAG TPA: TolC family outer membrane protein [Novosphingobium sp.]